MLRALLVLVFIAIFVVNISFGAFLPKSFRSLNSFGAAAAVAAFAAPKATNAGLLSKAYSNLQPYDRLSTTPLFYVCNSGGNPYLQEDIQTGNPSQRVITYFMSSEDAFEYLNEMAQGSPSNVNDFKVMTTSMDKIMTRIQKRKQSRKLGRFDVSTVYRIQPSTRQSENAMNVVSEDGSKSRKRNIPTVPMFSAKGIGVIRDGTKKTILPYYFSLEDLMEDWESLRDAARDAGERMASRPNVEVVDMTEVLCAAHDDSQFATTIGLVPPRREIEQLRRYYRRGPFRRDYERSKLIGGRQ
jgi:hypothetical protein